MPLESLPLRGQRALVTGAAGGIGGEIARALAEAGAAVGLHCNTGRERADALLAELPGEGHEVLQADLTDPAAIAALVDGLAGRWGRIDVLVNNAAIGKPHPLAEVSYEEWQRAFQEVLAINLIAATNLCYCVGRVMIGQGGGRIINVGSRGAYRGEPRTTSYGASKAALHAFSQSLAQELAPHKIYVTAVAPGFVNTGMAAGRLAGPQGDAIRAQSPVGRVAEPTEVANVVRFLACPGSEFLTGSVVDINGASYLR